MLRARIIGSGLIVGVLLIGAPVLFLSSPSKVDQPSTRIGTAAEADEASQLGLEFPYEGDGGGRWEYGLGVTSEDRDPDSDSLWGRLAGTMPRIPSIRDQFPELRSGSGSPEEEQVGQGWYASRMESGRTKFDWPGIQNFFAFGDSMSRHAAAWHVYNGDRNSLGTWPEMRWADFLHIFYRDEDKRYSNFGTDGAVINRTITTPNQPDWIDLSEQIALFEEAIPNGPSSEWPAWRGEDTLFAMLFGLNDIKQLARLRGSEDHVPLVHSLVDSLLSNSAHLHNIGARHFLLLTAVPIELTPEASLPDHGGYTDRHLTGSDARLFNHLLRKGATEWEERCGDCNVMVFDLEIYLRLIRRWPEGFGLTDTTAFEKTIGDIRQERGKMGFMWDDRHGHLSTAVSSNAAIFKDYLPLMRGLISLVVVLATTIPFPTLVGASPIHHSPRSPRGHGNVHGNARRGGGALLPRQSGGSCTDGDWNCDGMKLQRCNYGSWIEIETCITGQACSSDFTANYVIGCYWTSDSSAVSPVPASQTVAVSSDVVASSNPLSASVFSASSAASTASVAANSAVTTGSASASIIGDGALASKPSSSVGSVSATSVKAVVASTGVVGTSVTGVVAGSSAAPSVVASSVIASSVAASSVVVSSVVASAAPSASASSSSGSNSTVTPGTFSAPHYVLYADQWLTQPPDPSTISAYNHFLLSFWEPTGPLDDAQAWTELDATTRTSVLNEYHAAGIALMVSAFGSTGTPTSSGNDPTQVAQELAAFVKEYDLDGVDVDYEDFTAFNGGTAEAWLITFQTELRSLLPSPYLISHAPVAPWFVASDYTNGGGGYAHVNQEVGSGIDFYNVQFYSQGASEYTDCTTLLTAAASPWQGSSLFEIANNQGVELNKLVIGKPVDSSAASNGYMDAGTLAGCVTQAKGQGWNAGLMVWEYRPSDPTEAQTFMSTARGSS